MLVKEQTYSKKQALNKLAKSALAEAQEHANTQAGLLDPLRRYFYNRRMKVRLKDLRETLTVVVRWANKARDLSVAWKITAFVIAAVTAAWKVGGSLAESAAKAAEKARARFSAEGDVPSPEDLGKAVG